MHNKSFFQGLGLGLVIASVVFLVLYSTRVKESGSVEESAVQTAEIETQSTTSILDLPDKSEEKSEIETIGEIETINREPLTIEQREFTISSEKSNDTLKNTEEETLKSTEMTKSQADDDVSVETAHISIKSGDTASDIYNKLYELGITKDEKGFADYISKNGLSRKMLCGEFDIPKGADYKEIYDIIKSH